MARTRTTKAVAQRIDLNYFKRATPFKRAKVWLAILAPAVALVWLGYFFFAGDHRVYSSGRLSAAHAVLEKQCDACHVREAGGFSATAADAACLACHDGPPHHEFKTKQLACIDCHTEHQGAIRLTAVSSKSCALCHARLQTATWGHIENFEKSHPEFAALRNAAGATRDPETIKLNHALHMKAIRRGPSAPLAQLDCSDCHRPALSADARWEYGDTTYAAATVSYTAAQEFETGGSRGLPTKQPSSDRQLMAPVKFANACAGCHSLAFDKRFEEGAPHDTPEVVHTFLVKKFSEYIAAHSAELREVQEPQRNLAGRAASPEGRTVSAAQWVRERVAVSEELLWHKTCSQCHAISGTALQDVRIARWGTAGGKRGAGATSTGGAVGADTKLPIIAAAHTKLQWLPHARFDHDAHTGFSCTGCHQNALKSTETSDILIPSIAICQTCHAAGPGYASSQCSECHTYHDWSKRKEVQPTFTFPALRGGN
jgi:hypothetical protein